MSPSLRTRRWTAGLLLTAMIGWLAPALAQVTAPNADGEDVRLAIAQTPSGTALDEIVSGRARLGFSPVVGQGLLVVAQPDQTIWLRLRINLADAGAARYIALPRQNIEHMRLYMSGPPVQMRSENGIEVPSEHARWPDLLVLPLPDEAGGLSTVYLGIEGQGYLNLQPRLISQQELEARAAKSTRLAGLLYASLLALLALALLRRLTSGERVLRVALAIGACLLASVIGNFHLQLSVGGTSLAGIPALPPALWVMTCAPFLWATQQYAGLEKHQPIFGQALDWAGIACLLIGALMLAVPGVHLSILQLLALGMWLATALACAWALVYDPRRWRWGPILIWLGFIPALLAIPLSTLQWLPSTTTTRHGFQVLLALLLATYLLLPWARQALQQRAKGRRVVEPEASAEEKIAHAREWMISSLQAGIESAADADMEWIAYRRLMGGLKPVLPQTAAAVIAMNYHHEDLLLVEPKSAEPRFQMLLAQRGSLLKNLSRSLAPQQIGLDFNGPDGPLQHVLLAIIPLPIDRPGWGVLVIERSPNVSYSDEELDLCTEFAALATTAGDEAASVMQQRQATEIDVQSGVFKREMIEPLLRRAHEAAVLKRKPLSMLRVQIDGFAAASSDDQISFVRALADLLREEIDYGDTIARFADDEFVVVLLGRSLTEARTLGERLCASVRKQALPGADGFDFKISLGVAQVQPGERAPQLAFERAAKALSKARQYGGNQVQAISSGV